MGRDYVKTLKTNKQQTNKQTKTKTNKNKKISKNDFDSKFFRNIRFSPGL